MLAISILLLKSFE